MSKRSLTHFLEVSFFVSDGGNDDIVEVACTIEGIIEPYQPATPQTYWSGGEPSSGGYAELTSLTISIENDTTPKEASFLLQVLPRSLLEHWMQQLYEDWEQER